MLYAIDRLKRRDTIYRVYRNRKALTNRPVICRSRKIVVESIFDRHRGGIAVPDWSATGKSQSSGSQGRCNRPMDLGISERLLAC
jgi:hypothetical protein